MQEHLRKYILLAFMLAGCSSPTTIYCSDTLNIIEMKEYNLRVDKIYTNGRSIFFQGNPLNKNSNLLDSFLQGENAYLVAIKRRCNPGDTLYKEYGSLSTIIKKKDINIEVKYQCNDTSDAIKPLIRIVRKSSE